LSIFDGEINGGVEPEKWLEKIGEKDDKILILLISLEMSMCRNLKESEAIERTIRRLCEGHCPYLLEKQLVKWSEQRDVEEQGDL